jgi:hypothetical protein
MYYYSDSVFPTQGYSYVLNVQVPGEIRINSLLPASWAETPTKDLFDRLTFLSGRYRNPFLPGSTPPSNQAFEDAKSFILTLPLTKIKKPSIHVAADGEVNFQWAGSDFKIDLGFYGNGKFSFYAAKAGRAPIIGDDILVDFGLSNDLVSFAANP